MFAVKSYELCVLIVAVFSNYSIYLHIHQWPTVRIINNDLQIMEKRRNWRSTKDVTTDRVKWRSAITSPPYKCQTPQSMAAHLIPSDTCTSTTKRVRTAY